MRSKIPLMFLVLVNLSLIGCFKTTKANIPPQQIKPLQTATKDALIAMVNKMSNGIQSFQSSSMDVNAEGQNVESNLIEEYKNVPGYIFLERPRNIRLKILIPVSRTTLFDMASNGEVFQIWYPRENKFIVGNNNADKASIRKGVKNTLSNLRPQHLVDAILLERLPVNEPNRWSVAHQQKEGSDNFYVIEVLEKKSDTEIRLLRNLWIERVEMKIVRQQYFDDAGALIRNIRYKNYVAATELSVPTYVRIEQPEDNYSVTLTFRSVTLNKPLDKSTFVLQKPPSAEQVEVGG